MKRKVETILIAFFVLLSSCNTEREQYSPAAEEPVEWVRSVAVQFKLSDGVSALTRAVADTVRTPALDREKHIDNIHAVVFNDDNSFYNTFQAWKVDSVGTYNFDMLKPGDYHFYLIANANDSLLTSLTKGVENPTELGHLLVKQSPGDNNEATNFLMTAEPSHITTAWGGLADAGFIKLQRAAARFDFYNRVPNLRITRITYNNRNIWSRLTSQPTMDGITPVPQPYYLFADSTGMDLVGTIYGYENLTLPGETSFTLEGMYNNVEIKPYTIYFDPAITVKRNCLYSIILNPKTDIDSIDSQNLFGSLQYDVKVNDWSEGAELHITDMKMLYNRDIPNFYAKVEYVTTKDNITTRSIMNPNTIEISPETTDIDIVVTHASTSSLLKFKKKGWGGVTISGGEPSDTLGQMIQTFRVHIPDTVSKNFRQEFTLSNKLDKTQNHEFVITKLTTSSYSINNGSWYSSGSVDGHTIYRSNSIGHNGATSCNIQVTDYSIFQVYARVESESCCDFHVIKLDTPPSSKNDQSGQYWKSGIVSQFEPVTINISSSGTHYIYFYYGKDGSVVGGADAGFFYVPEQPPQILKSY